MKMWESVKLFTITTVATVDFVARHPHGFFFFFWSAGKGERVSFFCHSIPRSGLDQRLHQTVLVPSHTIPDYVNLPRDGGPALTSSLPKCLSPAKEPQSRGGRHIQALKDLHSQCTFTGQERPPPIFGSTVTLCTAEIGGDQLEFWVLYFMSYYSKQRVNSCGEDM